MMYCPIPPPNTHVGSYGVLQVDILVNNAGLALGVNTVETHDTEVGCLLR